GWERSAGRRRWTATQNARRRQEHAVQDPFSSGLVVVGGQAGDHRRSLLRRHKEEREVIAVIEDSVARAHHRLRIRRPCQSNSGLEFLSIWVDEETKPRFPVVAQTVVHGQRRRELPLVLSKEAEVAVVESEREVADSRGQERIGPACGQ